MSYREPSDKPREYEHCAASPPTSLHRGPLSQPPPSPFFEITGTLRYLVVLKHSVFSVAPLVVLIAVPTVCAQATVPKPLTVHRLTALLLGSPSFWVLKCGDGRTLPAHQ